MARTGLIATKMGNSSLFDTDGMPIHVTILKIEECQWADFLHRYRYVKPSPLAESFLFLGIKDRELHLDAWDITRIVFLGSRKQSDSCLIVSHDI